MKTKTIVTIAAYNEEKIIGSILEEIPSEYGVLVINDGSVDRTREICLSHGAVTPRQMLSLHM